MIIQCDQCDTRFRLDDSKVTGRGVRVKCTKCQNLFVVAPPESEAEPEKAAEESFQPTAGGGDAGGGVESSEGVGGFDFGEEESEAGESEFAVGGEETETTWEDAFGSTEAPGEGEVGGESTWKDTLGEEEAPSGMEGFDLGIDTPDTGGEPGEESVTGSGEGESEEDMSAWEIGAPSGEGGLGETVEDEGSGEETAAFSFGNDEEQPSAETGGGDLGFVSEKDEAALAPSEEEGVGPDDFILEDEESGADKTKSAPARGSKVKILLLLLLLFIGVAFYFTGGTEKITGLLGSKESAVEQKPLEIVKLKAYPLENSRFGDLFVIEGMVLSLSDIPVPVKGIKGIIMNREGRQVGAKVVPPGRIISEKKLLVVSKSELDDRFRGKTSSQIPSKGSVPFMIIFPAKMADLDEYSVEVLR